MTKLKFLSIDRKKIAYKYFKRGKTNIIFLHGLLSNMDGKKSRYFNNYCRKHNYSYLCFDFRGHGKSSGDYNSFGIGDWVSDLKLLLQELKIKKSILIGSSMGGWVGIFFTLNNSSYVKKFIGIAPAPDFTEDLIYKNLSKYKKMKLKKGKSIMNKTENYTYEYSPNLFKNSKNFLINKMKNKFNKEVIFFHGSADKTVPYTYNNKFFLKKNFIKFTNVIIKDADHSMSDLHSLRTITKFI